MPINEYLRNKPNDIFASSPQANANLLPRPGDQALVYRDGFEEPYGLNGGAKMTRENLNYLIRVGDAAAQVLRDFGLLLSWDSAVAYKHTSTERSYVTGSDGHVYQSVQASTNVDPVADGDDSHWKRLIPDAITVTNASETARGLIQIASQSDADAGTDLLKAMPAALVRRVADARALLRAPDATEDVRGIVQLASTEEATAGTDDAKAITAEGLAARTPDASTTAPGLAQLATSSDVQSAVTNRVVTASGLPMHKLTPFTGTTPPASTSNIVEIYYKTES